MKRFDVKFRVAIENIHVNKAGGYGFNYEIFRDGILIQDDYYSSSYDPDIWSPSGFRKYLKREGAVMTALQQL